MRIALVCILLAVTLSPDTVFADTGRQADCRRCHTALPATHAPVAQNGRACLQCHAGHTMNREVGNSPEESVPRPHLRLRERSIVDSIGLIVLLVGMLGPVVHGLLFLASSAMRKPSHSRKFIQASSSRPVVLRGWHAINATTVLFLTVTGLGLRWFMVNGAAMDTGGIVRWHSVAGGWHVLTWGLWLGFNFITGSYVSRYQRPAGGWLGGIGRQLVHYGWGIFRGHPHPHRCEGFNPLQSVVYLLVIGLLLPVVMFSGVGLLSLRSMVFASVLAWRNPLVEIHFVAGCLLLAFLSVHLYLAVWGPEGRLWRRL